MSERCSKCEGDGQVADSEGEEPWSFWMDLPLKSSLAVLTGLVKPRECPRCGGTGQAHHPTPQAGAAADA